RYNVEALAPLLASGEAPHLGVTASCGSAAPVILSGIRLSALDRPRLHRALDPILGRMITLLIGAVGHLISGRPLQDAIAAPLPQPVPAPLDFWLRRLAGTDFPRIARRLQKPFVCEDWRVGLRRQKSHGPPAEVDLDPATF